MAIKEQIEDILRQMAELENRGLESDSDKELYIRLNNLCKDNGLIPRPKYPFLAVAWLYTGDRSLPFWQCIEVTNKIYNKYCHNKYPEDLSDRYHLPEF